MGANDAAADLSGRWQVRPLLVFAADLAAAERQTALLADGAVRDDLRLAVYVVTQDAVEPWFGAPSPGTDAVALRRRFAVAAGDLRVVLVGLDGGAKLTSEKPLPLAALAATIDRMPMRREELRARGE